MHTCICDTGFYYEQSVDCFVKLRHSDSAFSAHFVLISQFLIQLGVYLNLQYQRRRLQVADIKMMSEKVLM